MNGNRLHNALLKLWDKAVDQPGYDKREWSVLQAEVLALEARLRILRLTLAAELLSSARGDGEG